MKSKYFIRFKTIIVFLILGLLSINSIAQCPGGAVGGTLPTDDFDGDGICNNLDADDDNDGILDAAEGVICKDDLGETLICSKTNEIAIHNLDNGVSTTVCNDIGFIPGDIGIDTSGEVYVVQMHLNGRGFYHVDTTNCDTTRIGTVGQPGWNPQSLSFLPDGSALVGFLSQEDIYRVTLSPFTSTLWATIPNYTSSGDFLYVGNNRVMYMADSSAIQHVVELTLNGSYNYVSHRDLGELPTKAWGASLTEDCEIIYGAEDRIEILHDISNNNLYSRTVTTSIPAIGDIYGFASAYSAAGCTYSCDGGYESVDTDNDGLPNHLDLDSDSDGIADLVEAGGVDTDGNGVVDGTFSDIDGDGWSDTFDPNEGGGTPLTDPDSDGDGFKDRIDIDSDNDGIVDIIESQASGSLISPSGSDSDGDGIDDNFDTDNGNSLTTPIDTDADQTPDYIDINSDNDGQLDILEGWDTDNDGVADISPAGTDTDGDGLDDNFDNVVGLNNTTNVTNNGQTSASFPNLDNVATSQLDWREGGEADSDGDGIIDLFDIDDDNDGILDTTEGCGDLVSTIRIDIDLDNYEEETTWSLKDPNGNTALSGGPYGDADEYVSVSWTPNLAGTWVFTINDSYGDGLIVTDFGSDSNGESGYSIVVNGVSLYNSEPSPNFGSSESHNIFVGDTPTYGAVVSSQTGVGNSANITGSPDGSFAEFYDDTDAIVVDMGSIMPAGTRYIVTWKKVATETGGAALIIEESTDNSAYTMHPFPPTTLDTNFISSLVYAQNSFRYLRISKNNPPSSTDFEIDAIGLATACTDTDKDGVPDKYDLDSDSDGITDNIEGQTTSAFQAPLGIDTDGDGWDDRYDPDNGGTPIVLSNKEGADNPDYLDNDTDGDGFPDWKEGFDDDNDGDALNDLITRANNFEVSAGTPLYYVSSDDSDSDGIPDWLEDDDNDNVPNFLDSDHSSYYDTDNDGLIDLFDPDNFGVASILPDEDGNGEYDFRDNVSGITLPISLLFFKAIKEDQEVKLEWSTTTEINNDYFTIERSIDGRMFESLLTEAGAGNSNSRRDYVRFDSNPYKGYNYYRLRQTDFDGTTEVFDIKVVFFEGSWSNFKVFPNPSNGKELYIDLGLLNEEKYRVELYTSSHQLIKVMDLEVHEEELQISKNLLLGDQLGSGLYFIKIYTNNSQYYRKMIVR